MARNPVKNEKPLFWIGSSKTDMLEFPEATKDRIGAALGAAQFGGMSAAAKPWKGEGQGVFEVVESRDKAAYRAVYTVRFKRAVYVLHAFQKKSPTGIKTSQRDVEMVSRRLKAAREDYEERYGESQE